jgi:ribosome-associated heat shock protein Hsp15
MNLPLNENKKLSLRSLLYLLNFLLASCGNLNQYIKETYMRIDVLLNKLCMVKTRSIAKNACDKNAILVNNKPAKASLEIKVNDLIECNMFGYKTTIKITLIPDGNVAKKDVLQYYEIVSRESMEL